MWELWVISKYQHYHKIMAKQSTLVAVESIHRTLC